VNAYQMRSDGAYLREERGKTGAGANSHLQAMSRRSG
jgi:hypothetical protein